MKVVVIGSGKVGSAIVENLIRVQGLSNITLIGRNPERLLGEVLDIQHATPFNQTQSSNLYAGTYEDCWDADIIIFAAGPSGKPGQIRMDLIKQNVKMLKQVMPQINTYTKDCLILMVTNPVDILTYMAYCLSNRPRTRVFGTGTLIDTARLARITADSLNIDPKNIVAYMLGEHGETSFAVWSLANVCGLSIEQFCELRGTSFNREEAESKARSVGTEILRKKGYTNYGIAAAVTRIVLAILSDERSILPVSIALNGEYGISDVALSVPCIVGKNGIEKILEFPFVNEEIQKLNFSATFLRQLTNV